MSDNLTFDFRGHLPNCRFKTNPNIGINGLRNGCRGTRLDGGSCGRPISKQSCNLGGIGWTCIVGKQSHRNEYCELHQPEWDPELSDCANTKCDILGIPLEERKKITQFNIEEILGLPSDEEFNHISDSRRRRAEMDMVAGKRKRREVNYEESDVSDDAETPLTRRALSFPPIKKRTLGREISRYLFSSESEDNESENDEDRQFIVSDDFIEYDEEYNSESDVEINKGKEEIEEEENIKEDNGNETEVFESEPENSVPVVPISPSPELDKSESEPSISTKVVEAEKHAEIPAKDKIQMNFCPKCGNKRLETFGFCYGCGFKF